MEAKLPQVSGLAFLDDLDVVHVLVRDACVIEVVECSVNLCSTERHLVDDSAGATVLKSTALDMVLRRTSIGSRNRPECNSGRKPVARVLHTMHNVASVL